MKCISIGVGYVLASEIVAILDEHDKLGEPTGNCIVSVRGVTEGRWDAGGEGTMVGSVILRNMSADDLRNLLGWVTIN